MNYSVFRFTLNMHNHRSQVSVPVFVGDTGIRLLISLTDGGNTYKIEDGCVAMFRGKKPDGNPIFNQCLILNNTTIQYDFTEQTAIMEGIVTCEIDLYGADGTLITAPKFIIVVDSRSASDTDVVSPISEADVNIIPTLIATMESEQDRVEAEKVRKANELERQAKETERQANEVNRIALYEGVNNSVANLDTRISKNDRRITNLENKALSFVTDSDVAYIKDVPENALPYALISKIGGMSRKCTNLLQLFEINGDVAGVTVHTYTDGTFSITGTAIASGGRNTKIGQATLQAGTYKLNSQVSYLAVSNSATNAYIAGLNTFTLTEETTVHVGFTFTEGVTYNETGNIWLNKGDAILPFEPYFSGLRDAKVTEVKSVGKNLFGGIALANKIIAEAPTNTTLNTSAKTITYYAGSVQGKTFYSAFKPNTRYTFIYEGSGTASLLNLKVVYTDGTFDTLGSFSSANVVEPVRFVSNASKSIASLEGEWQSGYTTLYYDKCGIFEGVAYYEDFKPYVEHTLTIPESVQSIEGYGLGVDDTNYNYIDFTSKIFNRRFAKVRLSNLTWQKIESSTLYESSAITPFLFNPSIAEVAKMVINKYTPAPSYYVVGAGAKTDKTCTIYGERLYIYDTDFSTLDTFLSSLGDMEMVCELATPTTEDIPEIDNLISVEGGGTITFENEYGYDVPSEVYYQLEGVEYECFEIKTRYEE